MVNEEEKEDEESTKGGRVAGLFDEEEVNGEIGLAAELCLCGLGGSGKKGDKFVDAIV